VRQRYSTSASKAATAASIAQALRRLTGKLAAITGKLARLGTQPVAPAVGEELRGLARTLGEIAATAKAPGQEASDTKWPSDLAAESAAKSFSGREVTQ